MPEDTFFAYYLLSKEKNDRELKEFSDDNDKDSDFVGEEDEDAVEFFESLTGYND